MGVTRPRSISAREFGGFLRLLAGSKEELVADLAATSEALPELAGASAPRFSDVLLAYLKAYGSGEFVARNGVNLSKPGFSNGVSDEDIQGLATVFFEAFYDCWYADMPTFFSVTSKVVEVDSPDPNLDRFGPGDTETGISRALVRKYLPAYVTKDGAEPTVVASKFVVPTRVDRDSLTAKEAQAIYRLGNLAGRQAKSLSGTLFGFLSNVNVSFVAGADFAVGDNKTLLNLVQTIAEVSARRTSEYLAYSILRDQKAADRAGAGAGRAMRPDEAQLLHAVRGLED